MAAPQGTDLLEPGPDPQLLPPGLQRVQGVVVPAVPGTASEDPHAHCLALQNLQLRPDDVLVCAIPKAGTHWVWEMTSMLVRGKAEHQASGKEALMLEMIPVEQIESMPLPRVLNSHLPFRLLPRQARECRLVYVTRNPKDVAVSTFHHMAGTRPPFNFQGSFSQFLRTRFLAELPQCMLDWFWMTRDWEDVMEQNPDLRILTLSFEALKEDPEREVRRLAEFLGAGQELVEDVARQCHFASMKQAEAAQHNPLARFFQDGYSMYRKGEVGDWKNWFTVADNELFDQVFSARMAGSRQTFRYSL